MRLIGEEQVVAAADRLARAWAAHAASITRPVAFIVSVRTVSPRQSAARSLLSIVPATFTGSIRCRSSGCSSHIGICVLGRYPMSRHRGWRGDPGRACGRYALGLSDMGVLPGADLVGELGEGGLFDLADALPCDAEPAGQLPQRARGTGEAVPLGDDLPPPARQCVEGGVQPPAEALPLLGVLRPLGVGSAVAAGRRLVGQNLGRRPMSLRQPPPGVAHHPAGEQVGVDAVERAPLLQEAQARLLREVAALGADALAVEGLPGRQPPNGRKHPDERGVAVHHAAPWGTRTNDSLRQSMHTASGGRVGSGSRKVKVSVPAHSGHGKCLSSGSGSGSLVRAGSRRARLTRGKRTE